MKRCILLAISFILLLGLIACAVIPEGAVPGTTVPETTIPENMPSEPPVTDPVVKEELVTIPMVTKVRNTCYYTTVPSETVESVLEYDDNYGLTNVKMYDEDGPVYEYVYDKDPDRLLVAQYIDSE